VAGGAPAAVTGGPAKADMGFTDAPAKDDDDLPF